MENLTAWALFKNASYLLAFIASVEWLGLSPQAMAIFGILMVVDVVTGMVRSARLNGCKSIKSSSLSFGVVKKLLLLTAIFSIAIAGKAVGFDMASVVQGSVSVLILGELYSILGNIHSARTCQPKVEFDAVTYLLNQVGKALRRILG